MSTYRWLSFAGTVLLLAVLGAFVYTDMREEPVPEALVPEITLPSIKTDTFEEGDTTDRSNRARASTGVASNSIPIPDLSRPIQVASGIAVDIADNSIKEIQRLAKTLKENQEAIGDWQVLGIYHKAIGDYKAAEEIWQFVTKKWPSDTVAYNNLGDLYREYLKDYPKAEMSFKAAIEKDPGYISGYVNLYELYQYFLKEKAPEAPQILKEGLEKNPRSIDLMMRLARYYADTGANIAKAREYYDKAIAEATRIGENDFAEKVRNEKESLK
jgi:tetratricopeptide (TPR) repeat protein